MDSKKAEALLEKYWRGETTQVEEAWIKRYFSEMGHQSKDGQAGLLFAYFETQKERGIEDDRFDEQVLEKTLMPKACLRQNPGKSRRLHIGRAAWYVAACSVLMVAVGYLFRDSLVGQQEKQAPVVADTYSDPRQAYEATKKALLFISSKLNEGEGLTAEISKFNETQEKIKAKK